ncbi:MAG: hypothetical protein ACREN7_03530 [Candidatus Dormibacteria bacterium]
MAWPIVALLLLAFFVCCWVVCAAALSGWRQRSWPLLLVAAAGISSLFAEVAALNGSALGGSVGGIGIAAVFAAGIAIAAFAYYLVTPVPEEPDEDPPARRGPALYPDSEA